MIKVFKSQEDLHVLKDFKTYLMGDIIPAGKLPTTEAIKLWTSGYIKSVGTRTYTKAELQAKGFSELKELGKPYGITDRSKKALIEELLKVL